MNQPLPPHRNSMKTRLLTGLLVTFWGTCPGRASIYLESASPNQAIPQGDPTGLTVTLSVSDIPSGEVVSDLTVTLNISGGYNGGLSAYLQAPNGSEVTLLAQPGVTGENPFGAPGSGFDLVLSDAGSSSIQTASEAAGEVFGSGSGSIYQAAGSLSGVNGSPADGTYTLFFADMASGGGSPTLDSFSLDVTAVPEPVAPALAVFLPTLLAWTGLRWMLRRRSAGRA